MIIYVSVLHTHTRALGSCISITQFKPITNKAIVYILTIYSVNYSVKCVILLNR